MKPAGTRTDMKPAVELAVLLCAAWLAFAAVPIVRGELGISWDAINHHFYLGWTAAHPRFDLDVLAGNSQVYQFPYLYWPLYQLSAWGATGVQAGIALAALYLLAVPPVWQLARDCMPGQTWFDAAMRAIAVTLAFMTGVTISLFGSTSNDLLAAIPMLWAISIAMAPFAGRAETQKLATRSVAWSAVLAGVAIAFKLSNAPIAVVLALLWVCVPGQFSYRVQLAVLGGFLTVASFAAVYGYWGWQLASHYGNPFFPFLDRWFDPFRKGLPS
ncbi:MAG: hypothetical protein V4684_14425 [Pseudomonadota bacterium]